MEEAAPSRRENAAIDRPAEGANPLAAVERVAERMTSRVAVADPKFIVCCCCCDADFSQNDDDYCVVFAGARGECLQSSK